MVDTMRLEVFAIKSDVDRYDAMWGPGNWIVHEGCPDAVDAGQGRAVHHREYHDD